jgi:hypothetical protein
LKGDFVICAQSRPSQEDLDRLMEGLRPEVAALLEARAVPDLEAERLVAEVVMEAAWRWHRLRDPAGWVLKTLDRRTRPRPETSEEETAR